MSRTAADLAFAKAQPHLVVHEDVGPRHEAAECTTRESSLATKRGGSPLLADELAEDAGVGARRMHVRLEVDDSDGPG